MNKPAIHYASEKHRMHTRFEMPIRARIGVGEFDVQDWSYGGFGIICGVNDPVPEEKQAELIYPFDGLSIEMSFPVSVRYTLPLGDGKIRVGFAFGKLTKQQMADLRYLATAQIEGRMVNAGALLAMRENPSQDIEFGQKPTDPNTKPSLSQRIAGAFSYGAWTMLFIGVFGFVALKSFESYATKYPERAALTLNAIPSLSPVSGAVSEIYVKEGDRVQPGSPLFAQNGDFGQTYTAIANCDCLVGDLSATPGTQLEKGSTALLLLDPATEPVITAYLDVQPGWNIASYQTAYFTLLGESAPRLGAITNSKYDPTREKLIVTITPKQALPLLQHDLPVKVTLSRFELPHLSL